MRTALLFLLFLAACGDAAKRSNSAESAQAVAPVTLDSGVVIHAQLPTPVISTAHKAGDTLTAIVVRTDSSGAAGVPFLPGASLFVRIAKLEPTGAEFTADSLSIRSRVYRLTASVDPITPMRSVSGAVLLDRATQLTVRLNAPLALMPPQD